MTAVAVEAVVGRERGGLLDAGAGCRCLGGDCCRCCCCCSVVAVELDFFGAFNDPRRLGILLAFPATAVGGATAAAGVG